MHHFTVPIKVAFEAALAPIIGMLTGLGLPTKSPKSLVIDILAPLSMMIS
jgi:hypothetical protein